jgi:hypothetical protein
MRVDRVLPESDRSMTAPRTKPQVSGPRRVFGTHRRYHLEIELVGLACARRYQTLQYRFREIRVIEWAAEDSLELRSTPRCHANNSTRCCG